MCYLKGNNFLGGRCLLGLFLLLLSLLDVVGDYHFIVPQVQ